MSLAAFGILGGIREMKRWKYLVCFFGLMLFFTMLSRGIYAHKMARVTLGKASSKSLTRILSAEGLVDRKSTRLNSSHA